jgi:hypothetical protein
VAEGSRQGRQGDQGGYRQKAQRGEED